MKIYNNRTKPNSNKKKEIIDFLFDNLEEYGDPKVDIENSINYALKEITSFGGFLLISYLGDKIVGATVVNRTGMKGYIPENVLVYIATHKNHRGKGIGKKLMKKAIDTANGSIALHVESDNPARFLYEKVGFVKKYDEMRLIK